jgi:hypothetical protein
MLNATVCPWITVAAAGAALIVKVDDVVTLNDAVDVALCIPTVTVSVPAAAPAGTTKAIEPALYVVGSAEIVPPPRRLIVTVGVPEDGARFAPVIVTSVPIGPD